MDRQIGEYCNWFELFDDADKIHLQDGLRVIAKMSALVSIMFYLNQNYGKRGILTRNPVSVESYRNIQLYFYSIYFRNFVLFISGYPETRQFIKKWIFYDCQFFSFIETFSSVLEIETLTHVCVERYVIAKYITNGWVVPKDHYPLYFSLSMMFAFVYGVFFDCDFAGCMCSFDLVLPNIWKKQFIMGLFLLRSVKPTAVIVMMLIWTRWMEKKFDSAMKKRADFDFTRIVVALTTVNLICWSSFSILRGWVLLAQGLKLQPLMLPVNSYIRWAMWIHAAAPMVTLSVMALINLFTRRLCNCPVSTSYVIAERKQA